MSNFKFLFTAYTLFDDLLRVKPMMTGCYNWLRVFDGDVAPLKKLDLDTLEKYDAVMVNMDGYDWRIVPELSRKLENSSTKLVANQDYAPETYKSSFEHISDFRNAIETADRSFATSPAAQRSMDIISSDDTKVYLNPHPCETHIIKRIKGPNQFDSTAIFFHRYSADTINPWIILQNLGIDYVLAGWYKRFDEWHRRTKSMYPQVVPFMKFPDFIKFMNELYAGLFVPASWTYGRIPCDAACAGLPLVVSNTMYSGRVIFPLTAVDPMDYDAARKKLKRLYEDETFYREVLDIASYNVEFFGHDACRGRFMTMVEET